MENSRKAYNKLCTGFSKPFACDKEVDFYAKILKGVQGPVLIAMCGSMRLFLPFFKAWILGFRSNGTESSVKDQPFFELC
jgi:hypothetical protein